MVLISTQHAATPPPLYLTSGSEVIPYCHTCGRVISKYCGSFLEVYHGVCALRTYEIAILLVRACSNLLEATSKFLVMKST